MNKPRHLTTSALYMVLAVTCCSGNAFCGPEIPGAAQKGPIALVGGLVHTISGKTIANATVLFESGKITAIGQGIQLPSDCEQVDVSNKHVYPGLIDADTTLGLVEIEAVRATIDSREVGEMNPNARAVVAFNPDSELVPVARADGVLVSHTIPRGGVISGQSALLVLDGWNAEDMALVPNLAMHLNWPRTFARRSWFRPESARDQMRERTNRLKKIRDEFEASRHYHATRTANPEFPFDPRLEALSQVTGGKMPLLVRADELRQIQEAVTFAVDQDIRLVIAGGYDAAECAELLKKHNVPVIVTGTFRLPQARHAAYDAAYTLPSRLQEAGVTFCLAGFDRFSGSGVRNLPQHAGNAVAYGLSREDALRAITLSAAEILGVGDRLGSIEVGKDATLIVTDGDVLEVRTQTEMAWISGRAVDLDSRHKRLYRKYRTKYERQTR